MSCYESEHGTIKIPRGAYVGLRRAVAEAYNVERQKVFDAAVKARESILAAGKRKRSFDFSAELGRQDENYRYVHLSGLRDDDDCPVYAVRSLLFPRPKVDVKDATGKVLYQKDGDPPKKPVKPKKNAAGFKSPRDTSFSFGESHIGFNDEQKTVTWDVSENNHAVERAHEHPIARAFFAALKNIKWTRGTGGTICGNDEYNRDSEGEGGGGNYVNMTFGPPLSKAAQKRHDRMFGALRVSRRSW